MAVKVGYKRTDLGVLPEDWGVEPLAAVTTCLDGLRIPLNESQRSKRQGDIPYCGANGVLDFIDDYVVDDDIILIAEDGGHFSEYATRPIAYRMSGRCWVNNHAHILKARTGTDQAFIFYSLVHKDILRYLASGTRAKLNRSELDKIEVALPPKRVEQEAIAEALGDVDALIKSMEQLLAKQRQVKQGAMQELLAGKRRLPGFSGEWEQLVVGDVVVRYFCGPSPTCEERNISGDEEWGVLKTTAITWQSGWDWTKHKALPRSYWHHPELEVRAGDVIVTKAGPRHRVGVSTWVDACPAHIIVSGKMIGLRLDRTKAAPLMLSSAIASRETQMFLDQRTTGMAESQVNFENAALLRAPIRMPRIEEQIALSKTLGDTEAEVSALQASLHKARLVKQGMMQEILTGRIRLL
jgi:type I restriction enzyme S subunit